MTTNVVLLHYNNYFNRIVKKEDTLAGYLAADSNSKTCSNVNFVPADGVTTSIVIGFGTNPVDLMNNYDYLVVTDENSNIISRWFIIEAHRLRGGQYELVLKRDAIADYYNDVMEAPTYIEKGYINSVDNPLLYNKESLAVNQIKQYEVPLKDESKTGWVVGYIPRDSFNTQEGTQVESTAIFSQGADIEVDTLADWDYWQYCSSNAAYKPVAEVTRRKELCFKLKSEYQHNNQAFWSCRTVWSYVGQDENGWWQATGQSGSVNAYNPQWPESYMQWSHVLWSDLGIQNGIGFGVNQCNHACQNLLKNGTLNGLLNTYLADKLGVLFSDTVWNQFANLDGKILYDRANNLYYRVRVKWWSDSTRFTIHTNETGGQAIYNWFNNNLVRTGFPDVRSTVGLGGNLQDGEILNAQLSGSAKYLELEQVAIEVVTTINKDRLHLEDAPYDMFCIPYSDTIQMTDGVDTWTCNKAVALSIATDIGAKSGSGNVYDIQLLPYCPNRALINASNSPSEILDISSCNYDLVQTTGEEPVKITAVIWCPRSTFSFEINALEGVEGCFFKTPYSDIEENVLMKDRYYIIPDLPQRIEESGLTRTAISTTSSNSIHVYKIEESSGIILEDMGLFNCIELTQDNINDIALHIYKYGNHANPEVSFTYSTYNSLSVKYVFALETNSYGGQYVDIFRSIMKYPNLVYYNVNIATPEEVKATNDCNVYRLSAGNYSAIFEFSPAKSKGFKGYIVDCTYKPFQPWLHVIPKLGFLYGENFVSIDDARGLICGGDYSLTQLNNTWANYKLTNKTYQEAFDRDIQHMDHENSIARQEQLFQSISGTLTGGVTGAVAGGMAGGPWGAVAGAVVGTGASLAGGIMDYNNLVARQEENKDYAKDKFNFSLQNIQAIPTALSKTSAIVANTRVWPFLEVYTCTEMEKQAYLNKLKYDGMTIMAVGKLGDYVISGEQHYFKGQIIRLPTIKDESHMANEIYKEIAKGVYI